MARALKFNPSFQTDDQAIENFVVRQAEFERIVRAFAQPQTKEAHFLVVAPRGAGKTTLCRRFLAETRRLPALKSQWQAVYLGEESYVVTSPGEFFLECLAQLKEQAPSPALDDDYANATATRLEDDLLEPTLAALRSYSRAAGRRLVIIVENFHTILNQQMRDRADAEELLRLLDDDIFGVLATSVVQPSDPSAVTPPVSYSRIELHPLSLAECKTLWESLTDEQVTETRLRPLEILTGGSPRMIHILAEFMRTPSLKDLMANLNFLIDENTEYFKSLLDGLPSIERKIFATLLDLWDPSTAKQIAEAARVTTNTASSMLARLTDRGAVIKGFSDGRTAIYYAAERLFNIYYLMRRRNHPSSRVRALVTFMIGYYDSEELADTTAMLAHEACKLEPARRGDYHSIFDAIMSRSNPATRDRIMAKVLPEFIQSFRDDQRASREHAVDLPKSRTSEDRDHIKEIIARIESISDEGDYDRTRELILEAIEKFPGVVEFWIRLSLVEGFRSDSKAAVSAAEKAVSMDPNDSWARTVLGLALDEIDDNTGAEASFRAAVDMDPGQPAALNELAEIYEKRGEVEAALGLFEKARAAGLLVDGTRSRYGRLLARHGRSVEAEKVLREDLDIQRSRSSRRALVDLLESQERQSEGIELLEAAAESAGDTQSWFDLGRYLLSHTTNKVGAARALRQALQGEDFRPDILLDLAQALRESEGQASVVELARSIRNTNSPTPLSLIIAGLIFEEGDDDKSAEEAYRAALPLEDGSSAFFPLAKLLLRQPQRIQEAETVLRDAVAATPGNSKCVPCRELAELHVHNGEDAQARKVIETALAANKDCVCCMILDADICHRRGDLEDAREHYRTALELRPSDTDALTGLAELVPPAEAAELIDEAMKHDPENPRVLLTRARLNAGDAVGRVQDAEKALELAPSFIEARIFLASALTHTDLTAAIGHLMEALTDLPSRKELIPSFVEAAIKVSRVDTAGKLTRALTTHPNGEVVEPVKVAIQMMRGETPMVAKEIADVAKDIVSRSTAMMH